MLVIFETDAGFFQLAAPLNVDIRKRVDQDIRDRSVAKQWLKRSQTEELVMNFTDQTVALAREID